MDLLPQPTCSDHLERKRSDSSASSSPSSPGNDSRQDPGRAVELPFPFDYPDAGYCAGMVGRSAGMRRLFDQLRRIAPRFRVASIEAEDGAGKSSAAHALHRLSSPVNAPFVPCLASAFLQQTATQEWDSALVGSAQGGMLLLDRIHELDAQEQTRLVRFLLWFEHQRYTSSATVPRHLVVTTALPLHRLPSADSDSGDLQSRLAAIRLVIPPLRSRREDIPLLAQVFSHRFSRLYKKDVRGLGPGTLEPLLRYPWPGNVRQFESVIQAAALATRGEWIRPVDLPILPGKSHPSDLPSQASDFNLDHAIHRHILNVLEQTHGNKLRAAALLGIGRSTLYRLLAQSPTEQR